MGYFASVNGLQIVSGQLLIPLVGLWTADLQLASSTQVTGPATVVIGNLTLTGYVYRSEVYGGQTSVRLVAGYGGWRTIIQQQGYGNSSGVMLSTVLNDAASACGETVNINSDTSIGNAYTRMDGVASDNLWQMVAQGFIPSWYIDPTGVTQTQAWPSANVSTPFTVTEQKPDQGMIGIATEDYVSWMPGCTFSNPLLEGTYTSGGVHYVFDGEGKFRFEVLTSTTGQNRFLDPLNAVIAKQVAPTRFYGRYEYTISNPTKTTVDCAPTDSSLGLPDLQNVPITADSVSSYTPPDGGTCHIQFLNGQPTRPICVWTDEAPTIVSLMQGTNPIARLGDQIQAFLPPVLPISGVVTIGGMPSPLTGTVMIANPITGVITQGSPQANTT